MVEAGIPDRRHHDLEHPNPCDDIHEHIHRVKALDHVEILVTKERKVGMSSGQMGRQKKAAGACAARTRPRGRAGGTAYLEQVDNWIGEEQRCGKQAQKQNEEKHEGDQPLPTPFLRRVRARTTATANATRPAPAKKRKAAAVVVPEEPKTGPGA